MDKQNDDIILESMEDIERVKLGPNIEFDTMRVNVRYKHVRDDTDVKQGSGMNLDVTPHTGEGVSLAKVLGYIAYDLKVKAASRVRGDTQSKTDANIEALGGHWKPNLAEITAKTRSAGVSVDKALGVLRKLIETNKATPAQKKEFRELVEAMQE